MLSSDRAVYNLLSTFTLKSKYSPIIVKTNVETNWVSQKQRKISPLNVPRLTTTKERINQNSAKSTFLDGNHKRTHCFVTARVSEIIGDSGWTNWEQSRGCVSSVNLNQFSAVICGCGLYPARKTFTGAHVGHSSDPKWATSDDRRHNVYFCKVICKGYR